MTAPEVEAGVPPVVVIGDGLAGALTALRLAQRGRAVEIAADRPGATALHGGAWLASASALAAERGAVADRLDAALAFAREALPELTLRPGPFSLLDAEGAWVRAEWAPATHARQADLGPRPAVVDLSPLGHPFAAMAMAALVAAGRSPVTWAIDWPNGALGAAAFGRSFAAVGGGLGGGELSGGAGSAEIPVGLALDTLVAALRAALDAAGDAVGGPVSGLLLPPILGTDAAAEERRAHLEAALGLPVAEATDVLPSAPGLRLRAVIAAALARAEIAVHRGRVYGIEGAGSAAGGPLVVVREGVARSAAVVVLATGGALPGGVELDREPGVALVDAALSCRPPRDPRVDQRPDAPYSGAWFRVGVATDAAGLVLRTDGTPYDPRVRAVGDVVGGADRLSAGSASGWAALSALLVADALAEEDA